MKRKEKVKNSTKKRLSFSFFKKHKALAVGLIIFVTTACSFLVVNYGRYVKEIVQVYYLRTKNFYFSSDKLTITGKTYEINPWSGTVPYQVDINMSSMLNSLKGTSDNISYSVECVADAKSNCYFGTRGTTSVTRSIGNSTHADNFLVTVELKDGVTVKDGDAIKIDLKATSISPYEEELSASFKLVIGDYGVNYKIEDEAGRLYLDAIVSNTLPSDTVRIVLEITDMSKYSIDMTNQIFNSESFSYTEDANHNINSITFNVEPKSSLMIRFYKRDANENTTYNGTGTPVITFTRLS